MLSAASVLSRFVWVNKCVYIVKKANECIVRLKRTPFQRFFLLSIMFHMLLLFTSQSHIFIWAVWEYVYVGSARCSLFFASFSPCVAPYQKRTKYTHAIFDCRYMFTFFCVLCFSFSLPQLAAFFVLFVVILSKLYALFFVACTWHSLPS